MPHRYSDKKIITVTVGFILNIHIGGLGTMLYFNYIFKITIRKEYSCFIMCFGYLLFSAIFDFDGIVCFAGILFCIFYSDITSKVCKIAFPICYSVSILLAISYAIDNDETNIGSSPIKKRLIVKLKKIK